MEMVRPHDGSPTPDASGDSGAEVLRALAAMLAASPPAEDLATRAVDRIVDLLGLSAATLSLVRKHEDALQLQAIASVGAHAAFTRDMSARPLESLADAARAVEEGKPVFVADEHEAAASGRAQSGVARWRSNVTARATGVLPVRAWGETVGVLTVEWPHSRPPDSDEQDTLQAAAAMLGAILRAIPSGEKPPLAPAENPDAETAPSVETSVLGVMDSGVIVPLSETLPARSVPAAVISIATRRGAADEAPLGEAMALARDRVNLAAAIATATGGDPQELAGSVRDTLHDLARQDVGPADALGYLEHVVHAAAPRSARVSAALCTLEITGAQGVCVLATAGAGMWALLSHDGRLITGAADRAALSAAGGSAAKDHYELLLPKDRFALLCGPFGPSGRAEILVRATLEPGMTGAEAARALVTSVDDPSRSVSAVVVEINERS